MSSVRQLRKNEKFLDELCQAAPKKWKILRWAISASSEKWEILRWAPSASSYHALRRLRCRLSAPKHERCVFFFFLLLVWNNHSSRLDLMVIRMMLQKCADFDVGGSHDQNFRVRRISASSRHVGVHDARHDAYAVALSLIRYQLRHQFLRIESLHFDCPAVFPHICFVIEKMQY